MHNECMTDDSFKTHYQMNESNERKLHRLKAHGLITITGKETPSLGLSWIIVWYFVLHGKARQITPICVTW